jgi:hypothetical protein
LNLIRSGEENNIPLSFLNDPVFCDIIDMDLKIDQKIFKTKEEIIKYIAEIVKKLKLKNILYDAGFWTWVAAFFFDSICPPNSDGERKIKEDSKYILNVDNWKKYYRHLLASFTRLYIELGESGKIYLAGSPEVFPDFFEQLASRQAIASCKGVIEAATILYWDSQKNKIKVRANNKIGKGVVRRFAQAAIPQFQMTYDLNSMSGTDIIRLLPYEYDEWISSSLSPE